MSLAFAKPRGLWIIAGTFLLAAVLSILPLPQALELCRPEWLALVLIYWVMALPHRIGLITAWVLGFFMDVLQGNLLGLNGLALALVAYLTLSLYQRLRMFTLLQQSSIVLILIGLHQLVIFWVLTMSNQNVPSNMMFMLSALSSAVLWPLVFISLRYLRRAFLVS
jgi:rod shape-determining protein MreD